MLPRPLRVFRQPFQCDVDVAHKLHLDEKINENGSHSVSLPARVMDMIQNVVDQFDQVILNQQIQSIVNDAWWSSISSCSGFESDRGEMMFQQAVYQPFTLALFAAAESNLVYLAGQDVLSSSFVMCNGESYVVSGKPNASLRLWSGDPIAAVEIKASEAVNEQVVVYHDWTSIA